VSIKVEKNDLLSKLRYSRRSVELIIGALYENDEKMCLISMAEYITPPGNQTKR